MNDDEITKKIQAENDSYNRDLNILQKEFLKLKDRHQRTIADLKKQKQQCSENIDFKKLNDELAKFL